MKRVLRQVGGGLPAEDSLHLQRYSNRSATIGSSFEAFAAG